MGPPTPPRPITEAASLRPGPPTCGDPDCDYCQGYTEESVVTPSEPYEMRKIVAEKLDLKKYRVGR